MAGGRQAGLIRDRLSQTDRIQQRLGLAFNRPSLLVEALTHPSYLNENPGLRAASYQRLEFLGDAILGSVTALELFQRYPELSEGELTRLRSHLVQERSLARIASELDLGDYLDMGRGEEASGGCGRLTCYANNDTSGYYSTGAAECGERWLDWDPVRMAPAHTRASLPSPAEPFTPTSPARKPNWFLVLFSLPFIGIDKRILPDPPVRSFAARKPTYLLSKELEPAQIDSLYSEFAPRGRGIQ